jgi:predicted RNA-binding Zn-ribbon protein involved in translation (DUF1610 family)
MEVFENTFNKCGDVVIAGKTAGFVIFPIKLILHCPDCNNRHIDKGEFYTKIHHTHACQHCGFVWRPAVEPTQGVQFLRGFKNETE